MKFSSIRNACIVAIAIAIAGCAPNVEMLSRKVDNQAYKAALQKTDADPVMEAHLAAQLVRQAAEENLENSLDLVLLLRRSGKYGQGALERILAGGDAKEPLKTLTHIALSSARPRSTDLEAYLKRDWSDVRTAAVRTFGRRLDQKQLMELALDRDERVRFRAVGELGRFADNPAVAELLKDALRRDPAPGVRATAARQSTAMGPGALDALRDALGDENAGVQYSAIRGLAKLETSEATALVADLLIGEMNEQTVVAASALAARGHSKAIQRFREAFESTNPTVRAAALVHLTGLEWTDADDLRTPMLDDDSGHVVYLAASELAKKETTRQASIEALKRVAEGTDPYRDRAVTLLAVLGDTSFVERARKAMAEAGTAEEKARLLTELSSAKALRPDISSHMADDDGTVRLAAAKAILSQFD